MFAPLIHPRSQGRRFGRREPFVHARAIAAAPRLTADARLFVLNFLGGLIFMTVFLA